MVRFFNLVFILSAPVSILYCLSLWRIIRRLQSRWDENIAKMLVQLRVVSSVYIILYVSQSVTCGQTHYTEFSTHRSQEQFPTGTAPDGKRSRRRASVDSWRWDVWLTGRSVPDRSTCLEAVINNFCRLTSCW